MGSWPIVPWQTNHQFSGIITIMLHYFAPLHYTGLYAFVLISFHEKLFFKNNLYYYQDMSKLSRAIKHQRRQKTEKRRLRTEKKMRNNILFSDTESDHEEPRQDIDIKKKEERIDATELLYGTCLTQVIQCYILEDVMNGTAPPEIVSIVKTGVVPVDW